MTMTKEKEKVINLIVSRMEDLELKVMDVADESGIPRNFLSMIRSGNAKVPLTAIIPMAKTLKLDPMEFAELVLATHSRDILDLFHGLMGEESISEHERNIIKQIRILSNGRTVRYTRNSADHLEAFVDAALKR